MTYPASFLRHLFATRKYGMRRLVLFAALASLIIVTPKAFSGEKDKKVRLTFVSGNSFNEPPPNAPEITGLFTYYDENAVSVESIPKTQLVGVRINTYTLVFTKDKKYQTSEDNNSDFIIMCDEKMPWKSIKQAYYVQLKSLGVKPGAIPDSFADEVCTRKWIGLIK